MGTFEEEANAYEPPKTLNIADLENFDLSEPVENKEATDKDGKPFTYYALIRDNKEYRIPNGVMTTIKNLIASYAKHSKKLKVLSVEKSGEGMQTKYSVVTIE